MPAKIIIFAGAPPPTTVTESSCTLTAYLPPFTNFLDLLNPQPQPSSSEKLLTAWRSLPLKRQPLHTGLSQQHVFLDGSVPRHAGFFSTADVSVEDASGCFDEQGSQDALTQFFEASLSAMENTSFLSDLDSFDTSFLSASSTHDTSRNSQLHPAPTPVAAHLSDLEDIPPAPRILALNPSTVTLNLIVGILSIAQPRSVTTRWGKAMSLIELLVGDDTRSGFAVTFWLPESDLGNSHISKIRRQEVVLLQNIALHVFRGKVYGQSLRKDMTKVSVLWSPEGRGLYSTRSLSKVRLSHPQMHKTKLVRDWVLKFVGADSGVRTRSKRKLRSWDEPPPDSQ